MPALSFQEEWLDKLLSGSKQQTTRQQTDRIKVGDVCHIYNQQRRRISDKPLRQLTRDGCDMVFSRVGGTYPKFGAHHWAHFLGKVKIVQVRDIIPIEMCRDDLNAWAVADGFKDFHPTYAVNTKEVREDKGANMWFTSRYGESWMHQRWTVIWWLDWQERYFEPRTI